MTSANIWTANKSIKEQVGNGGCTRIPVLKQKDNRGNETQINDNDKKAELLAKTFFPDAPNTPIDYDQNRYPKLLPDPPQLNRNQLKRHINKLSPYKAHSPDGIPNIVLQKCTDLIIDQLILIFRTILEKEIYFDKWRKFTMIVLRKPRKPTYKSPKLLSNCINLNDGQATNINSHGKPQPHGRITPISP